MTVLIVAALIVGFLYLIVKVNSYIDCTDVAPWRKFNISCPVCKKTEACWKYYADRRVSKGFGVHNMDAPTCDRCDADLAEPYMRAPYVAALVAEAKRAEAFKAVAVEYNAAVKTARKGASA